MRASEKDKLIARRLLELSCEEGRPSQERVNAVLATLREKAPSRHVQILREYARLVTRQIAHSTALIETAAALESATVEQIERDLSSRYDRSVSSEVHHNAELIAGIRIRLGDDVWDDSVATHLETLKS